MLSLPSHYAMKSKSFDGVILFFSFRIFSGHFNKWCHVIYDCIQISIIVQQAHCANKQGLISPLCCCKMQCNVKCNFGHLTVILLCSNLQPYCCAPSFNHSTLNMTFKNANLRQHISQKNGFAHKDLSDMLGE